MLSRKCVLLIIFFCFGVLVCSHLVPRSLATCRYYSDEPQPAAMVLVLATAEEIPRYLDYTDSKLTPVVRVKISYREVDKNRDNTEVQYEDLWYANGKPVGLVRHHNFDPQRSQIILRVNQPQLEESEMQAMANALIRVYLDASLNDNSMYSCIVPDKSFDEMINAFRVERFYAPGVVDLPCALDPSVNLPVHTTASGQNQMLQFAIQ